MTRKLDIGDVLSRIFQTYGSQAGVLLPAAFIVFLITGILTFLLVIGLGAAGGALGGVVGAILGGVIGFILSFLGILLFQGMVVQLVRDVQDGRRDFTIGDLFSSAAPAIPPMLGAWLLFLLAIAVPTIIVSLLLPLLGILVGLILEIVLVTIWAVVIPVIVLERPGVMPAFGRSRELVRGNELQVFAVILVVGLVLALAWLILGAIFGGTTRGGILASIGQLIAYTLTAPLIALAAPTIYYRLRALTEGAGGEPAAVGAGPTGGAAPGVGGVGGRPAEPAAAPQTPPPGSAGAAGGPARPGPTEPPPGGGSTPPPAADPPPGPPTR